MIIIIVKAGGSDTNWVSSFKSQNEFNILCKQKVVLLQMKGTVSVSRKIRMNLPKY